MKQQLLIWILLLGGISTGWTQTSPVSLRFVTEGDDVAHHKEVTTIINGQRTVITPQGDGSEYLIPSGSTVEIKLSVAEGYVDYLWLEDEQEVSRSYNMKVYEINNLTQSKRITVDCRRLVPVKFVCPTEGSRGKEVNIDEQDDYGALIAPEADGDTYMLPLQGSVYFDSGVDGDHFILCWLLNGAAFPSKPDIFFKQNIPEGFELEVQFYERGETRTITYTQPTTAVIRCTDRGSYGSPEIESGSTVDPGNEILFEIAPPDNPSGKVELHHWVVNGEAYKSGDDYYTDNSLSLLAFTDLEVTAVPMAEYVTPDVQLTLSTEEIDFGSILIGDTKTQSVSVTSQDATEPILIKLRNEIPSLTVSPAELPSSGGTFAVTFTPTARETIETDLIVATGDTEVTLPIQAQSDVAIDKTIDSSTCYRIEDSLIVWLEETLATIYTADGRKLSSGLFTAGSVLPLTEPGVYFIDIAGHRDKIIAR